MPEMLLAELLECRRVIVTAPSHIRARHLFEELVDHPGTIHAASVDAVRIRRTNGEERIDHPTGGWVRFGTIRGQRWHGLTADTVVVVGDVTDAQLAALMVCTYTAADARVIRR
jgi:hypothetical protein